MKDTLTKKISMRVIPFFITRFELNGTFYRQFSFTCRIIDSRLFTSRMIFLISVEE